VPAPYVTLRRAAKPASLFSDAMCSRPTAVRLAANSGSAFSRIIVLLAASTIFLLNFRLSPSLPRAPVGCCAKLKIGVQSRLCLLDCLHDFRPEFRVAPIAGSCAPSAPGVRHQIAERHRGPDRLTRTARCRPMSIDPEVLFRHAADVN
jgi:hypothetical protein